MADLRPATPAFERFVRETLGCQCAAEVFERVENDPYPIPGLPELRRRFAVGGRLLIYLAEVTNTAQAAARLDCWVSAGLAERDRRGMNRLRLVVALTEPTSENLVALEETFAKLPGLDDRVHLHVLPAEALTDI